MTTNVRVVDASEKIVLSNSFDGGTGRDAIVGLRWASDLQREDLSRLIHFMFGSDHSLEGLWGFDQLCYRKSVHNWAGNVWMGVGLHTWLVLQNVTSVEEFAYVTTDVEVDEELATRMISSKGFNIKHQVIKDTEALTTTDSAVEVFASHDLSNFSEWLFSFPVNLEKNFKCDNEDEEEDCFNNNKSLSQRMTSLSIGDASQY